MISQVRTTYLDNNKSIYTCMPILLKVYMFVIVISLLSSETNSQKQCATIQLPPVIPLAINQQLFINMNQHFKGPNISLTLKNSSIGNQNQYRLLAEDIVELDEKYQIQKRVSHTLGNILSLSVAKDMSVYTMLGQSIRSIIPKYYVYSGNLSNLEGDISAFDVPTDIGKCSSHQVSPNGKNIAVICRILQKYSQQDIKQFYTLAILNLTTQKWQTFRTSTFVISKNYKLQFLDNDRLAIVVQHDSNSYISLWDINYGRMLGIYDRTYFVKSTLTIADISAYDNRLYVLFLDIGIYKLKFIFDTLIIDETISNPGYQLIDVHNQDIILAKKGTLMQLKKTQNNQQLLIKYQKFPLNTTLKIQVSQQYIIAYTSQQEFVVYLRGIMSPYIIIQFPQYREIYGVFINQYDFLQVMVPYGGEQETIIQVILEKVVLSSPFLNVQSFKKEQIGQEIQIQIIGKSQIGTQVQNCNITFKIVVVSPQSYAIYQSIQLPKVQTIYLNMPSRANILLSQYGIGPNVQYQVQKIQTKLNITSLVQKISRLQILQFPSINSTIIKSVFTPKYNSAQAVPIVVDSQTQKFYKYYSCYIISDFYTKKGIQCTQTYRQFKFNQYLHYQIITQNNQPIDSFLQLTVFNQQRDQFRIRRFYKDQQAKLNSYIVTRVIIEGNNTFKENNITQIQYKQNKAGLKSIYVLLGSRKQLRIYRLEETTESTTIKLNKLINKDNLRSNNNSQVILFTPKSFLVDDNDSIIWVKVFDEILAIDHNDKNQQKNISKVVGKFHIGEQYGIDYGYILVGNTNDDKKQLVRQYLVVYSAPNKLQYCAIDYYFECIFEFKDLPLYGKSIPLKNDNRIIQTPIIGQLGSSKFSLLLISPQTKKSTVSIYSLQQLSTPLSLYLHSPDIPLPTTLIPNQQPWIPIPLFINSFTANPLLLVFEPQLLYPKTLYTGYSIFLQPYLTLILPQSPTTVQPQNIILDVFNEKDLKRHSLLIRISNYPENLTKGELYPYTRPKNQVEEVYIQYDTRGWVYGNVLDLQYSCQICREAEQINNSELFVKKLELQKEQIEQGWVQTRHKLWKKHQIILPSSDGIQILPSQSLLAIRKNNLIYLFSLETFNISASFQISLDPTDTIQHLVFNSLYRIGVSLLMRKQGQFGLISFSFTSSKGFILDQIYLSTSIRYIYCMYYVNSMIAVTDYDGVSLYLINTVGQMNLVYYVTQNQAGGSICWAQLLMQSQQQVQSTQNYMLIVTLCDYGVGIFKMQIKNNDLLFSSKQIIDLSVSLKQHSIRLPTDASFQRTLTTKNKNGYLLFAAINNFNSVQFQLYSNPKTPISQIKIFIMVHRYGDFTLTQQISIQPLQSRYLKVLYHGLINNEPKYITAVYDLSDLHQSQQSTQYLNSYIMETIISSKQSIAKFMEKQTMVTLTQIDKYNSRLSIYNVSNCLRLVVHNYEQVYTLPIFMIPSNPVLSLSIELILHGIDIVQWKNWQIVLLIALCIVLAILLFFGGRIAVNQYQRRRKLVPLLVDYPEYQQDMDQERNNNSSSVVSSSSSSNQNNNQKQREQSHDIKQQISDDQSDLQIQHNNNKPNRINQSERGSTVV